MANTRDSAMQFDAPDDCLLFFIDDTGHEDFDGQLVYGLGGCSVMAPQLEPLIRAPWREIRRVVKGSPDSQLHANDFPHETTREQQALVGAFFQSQTFGRFGAVLSTSTNLHTQMSPIQTIAGVMRNRFAQIAAWQPFNSIAVIFEASERADRLIEHAFGELQASIDDRPIPIECFFMPKSVAEPALEVADFIAHAIGGQARASVVAQAPMRRDFRSVFDIADQRLVSFMSIASVAFSRPTGNSAPAY